MPAFTSLHLKFSIPFSSEKPEDSRGGVLAWGGGLSDPLSPSWFTNSAEDSGWSRVRERLIVTGNDWAKTYFEADVDFDFSPAPSSLSMKLREIGLKPERHFRTQKLATTTSSDLLSDVPHFKGMTLADIGESNGVFAISLSDPKTGATTKIRSKKLVLASGAVLNGLLSALLLGKRVMRLGNHLTISGPSIDFEHLKYLGKVAQLPNGKSWETFQTKGCGPSTAIRFTLPREDSKWNTTHPSLKTRKLMDRARNSPLFFQEQMKLSRRVDSLIMADSLLGGGDEVDIEFSHGGSALTARLDFRISSDWAAIAESLRSVFADALRVGFEVSNPNHGGPISDAAHYYGTTPMRDDLEDVPTSMPDGTLRGTRGRVLLLGTSIFPEGGHAHPTLLSMAVSSTICASFLK